MNGLAGEHIGWGDGEGGAGGKDGYADGVEPQVRSETVVIVSIVRSSNRVNTRAEGTGTGERRDARAQRYIGDKSSVDVKRDNSGGRGTTLGG